MIVYGRNAVREALRGRRAATAGEILAVDSLRREPWLSGQRVRISSAEEIERACGSREHQGICVELAGYPYVSPRELLGVADPFIVALDEVQDPQNLGAICRTAECVGATGVVICERRAAAVTAAVCRASAGAVEHLRVAKAANLADFLLEARGAGCWSYGAAISERALDYAQPDYSGGVVVVFGAEGRGLRRRVAECCDALVAMPLRGRIGSLNVSAAAGALLYEVLQRRGALDSAP
ncbi:MAG TPA: 23S rRNA (guanosine(2251)-2'-O)-methyltransferase RlmB [Solirubrobacteraceae bacterium]